MASRGAAEGRSPITYEQANSMRDAVATSIALEGFHRQCHVLTLANLAQIVNVLQAVVMTDGPRMWLTLTYHVLRMYQPHIGATALLVEVSAGSTIPSGSSGVSATASRHNGWVAVTLTNRYWDQLATVPIAVAGSSGAGRGELLAADSPRAYNTADEPDRVAPAPLTVHRDGDAYRVELPPHPLATLVLDAR